MEYFLPLYSNIPIVYVDIEPPPLLFTNEMIT